MIAQIFSAGEACSSPSPPSFLAGTRIATEEGALAVETLTAGIRVRLRRGGAAAIVWVGYRRIDCARHPKPELVWPVLVAKNAFAAGVPIRDVYLSPGQAVLVDGALVPVTRLINGRSVTQVELPVVTYFHVELAGDEIVLAESLPVESRRDRGGRPNFGNGGGVVVLYPDFAGRPPDVRLTVSGPELEKLRRRLARRAIRGTGPVSRKVRPRPHRPA